MRSGNRRKKFTNRNRKIFLVLAVINYALSLVAGFLSYVGARFLFVGGFNIFAIIAEAAFIFWTISCFTDGSKNALSAMDEYLDDYANRD